MFTGIIEDLGTITKIEKEGSNIHFTLQCSFTNELKVDQSLAHNGVCLTVVDISDNQYTVTAIAETLSKTDLADWNVGRKVNLERCMPANGRFDGHIVQGHVDTVGICTSIIEKQGSWVFTFTYTSEDITVEKGSITVNGASLTVVDSKENEFSVHIIPFTYEHTVFHQLKIGDKVNLEFDIIGKYLAKMLDKRK
ncbi:riboflavin synthase [Brumimicrobium salinarum]|uniref:Riboflavin synthase n=1 Tax=Brumimicrobium salinarum TaxID=2058658 RepID=A0A2I0R0Y9_9FLAO|nr:riboflavin synthase [Brumimicrobium salinarum]PKR80243.1 riboflavin synthase [Brumimicrobium salinarum]